MSGDIHATVLEQFLWMFYGSEFVWFCSFRDVVIACYLNLLIFKRPFIILIDKVEPPRNFFIIFNNSAVQAECIVRWQTNRVMISLVKHSSV